jgi:biopolymer transport protein ExbD
MDMTPMIDMTFQLIAFFMIALNFSAAEQSERIKLPASILALPPDGASEQPITLQLTAAGSVLFAGLELPVDGLTPHLIQEREVMKRLDQNPTAATVIIRADASSKTGQVQELIKLCQQTGFEKFVLRAQQQEEKRP